ncbi:zinc finger matrin-type protein 5 [Denticeps clupeoides]|uniref:Zinc finger matrin-type protein 5 n=1 Tax=Denticeps clupeoides TaxID=299321 RepID=A0AAY4CH34_9TELE|nr:zinc finger matrin-type protein 5 [Denticeps clupeoides]
MGKRYYCDYCDRSFQDNMHNRKKHLNGVQHQRSKKAWFDNFRDAAAILVDEQSKKPCRKFLQTGQCLFGTNCRFSHMTERDLESLKRQVAGGSLRKDPKEGGGAEPMAEEWLARREKRRVAQSSGSVLNEEEDEPLLPPDLHQHFLEIPDLPPSLLPPASTGVASSSQWG